MKENDQIRKILGGAISNTSQSSEKISDKVNAASTIFISNTLESLSAEIKRLKNTLSKQADRVVESNNKHSKRMSWLTGALVFAAFIQLIVQLIQTFGS